MLTFSAEHGKNGEPRELPLIGPLAEMIEKRWELSALGCPYVFHRNGRPIKDFRESWAQACEAAGVPDLLFHDLRRSGVRRMDLNNIPRSVAMKISGHKTETVYKRYAIVTTDDVRRALQQVHAKATVIPLRKEA